MSFNIALSGIQAINEQLETVSHNIANAGTYGFKSSRANFAAVYAGTQANGVEVASLTQSITQNGGLINTGRGMDAMIQGRGFFTTRDSQGTMQFTRVGIFNTDKEGYLVDAAGRKVQGYGPAVGGALGTMGDVKVPTGQIPAVATTNIAYVGNLSHDWTPPTVATFDATNDKSYNFLKQSVVYDSVGTQHTLTQYFVQRGAPDSDKVDVHYAFDDNPPIATIRTLDFGLKGELTGVPTQALSYTPSPTVDPINFTIDYTGTTHVAGVASNTTNRSNGYASGAFVGVELAEDGSVVAKYSNEQQQVVGTLAIATFPDEGSLQPTSDTSWTYNSTSGTPLYNTPGTGLAGKLSKGTLEGSNVDITSELVGLMTSQRNYQANSKVITTENQMMQALMQAL